MVQGQEAKGKLQGWSANKAMQTTIQATASQYFPHKCKLHSADHRDLTSPTPPEHGYKASRPHSTQA